MEEGAIAVLDALGIKGILKKRRASTVITEWENVTKDLKTLSREVKKKYNLEKSKIEIRTFSDTIVIICKGKKYDALEHLSFHLGYGLCSSMSRGFFFRGAVSYGKFHLSKEMILGSAIDNAAQWHEQLDMIGIMIDPELTTDFTKMIKRRKTTMPYAFYKSSLKNSKPRELWLLDWPKILPTIFTHKISRNNPLARLETMFDKFGFGVGVPKKKANSLKFYKVATSTEYG